MYKCLKIYQLNIIKKIKKDYKKARERYQNLFKEGKGKKQQKLAEYRKKYYRMRKNALL